MAGHGRPKDGVASLASVPAIHVFGPARKKDGDARHRRQVYAVCARQTAMAGHDNENRRGEVRKRPAPEDRSLPFTMTNLDQRFLFAAAAALLTASLVASLA